MFQGLQDNQLKGAIEAMLFVTDEPVGTIALADMLEVEPGQAERALVELRDQLEDENRGIQLREVAGGWRLYTHPAYHELIERYVLSWDTRKLSQAAMETLAVVAYRQPVTRAEVEQIRGVKCDYSLQSLMNKELIAEVGRKEALGRPILYGTTDNFLAHFGISSLKELPPMPEKPKDNSDDAEMTDDVPELIP